MLSRPRRSLLNNKTDRHYIADILLKVALNTNPVVYKEDIVYPLRGTTPPKATPAYCVERI